MNIAIKPEHINTRETLVGKVSLVTGSTRALAAAGSDIVRRSNQPTSREARDHRPDPRSRPGTMHATRSKASFCTSRCPMLRL